MNVYDDSQASVELRTALDAARAAAAISRKYYAGNFTVTTVAVPVNGAATYLTATGTEIEDPTGNGNGLPEAGGFRHW